MTASRTIFLGTATPVTNTCSRLMATNDLPVVNQGDAQHSPRASFVCLWVSRPNECVTNNVLPDACLEIIWDGQWLFVAGPDTGPVPVAPRPGGTFAGLRFRPDRAPSFLGVPASELLDRPVALAELWGDSGAAGLADRLASVPTPEAAAQGQPVPQGRSWPDGHRGGQDRHLPRPTLPAPLQAHAQSQSARSNRTVHPGHHLPPARRPHRYLRGSWGRLLRKARQQGAANPQLGPTTRSSRPPSHSHRRRLANLLTLPPTSSGTVRPGLRPPGLAGRIVASTPRLSLSSQVSLRKCCSGTADGSIVGQLLATAESWVRPSPRRVRQSGARRRW